MDKKTQMLVGIGVLAVAGYLIWKQTQKKTTSAAVPFAGRRKKKRSFAGSRRKTMTSKPKATQIAPGIWTWK
jgi:hypothetical protein